MQAVRPDPSDRKTYIGGSDAPIIMRVSPYKKYDDLWLEKTGRKEQPTKRNVAMERGIELEPEIREWIEGKLGFEMGAHFIRHNGVPWMAASTDGWNQKTRTLLEIKTMGREDFEIFRDTALCPEKYAPQLAHNELCCRSTTDEQVRVVMACMDVNSKEKYWSDVTEQIGDYDFGNLLLEESEFWNLVQNQTPPPSWITDPVLHVMESELMHNQTHARAFKEAADEGRKKIEAYLKEKGLREGRGLKYKFKNSEVRGSIDYKQYAIDHKAPIDELEKYRRATASRWRLTPIGGGDDE